MTRFGGCRPMSWRRRASSARSSRHSSAPSAAGDRIAVEDREHLIASGSAASCAALAADALAQHALHRLGDHREAERIGAPARHLDGRLEFRFAGTAPWRSGRRARGNTRRVPSASGRRRSRRRSRRPPRRRESAACGGKSRAVPSVPPAQILARARPGQMSPRSATSPLFSSVSTHKPAILAESRIKPPRPADVSFSSRLPTRPRESGPGPLRGGLRGLKHSPPPEERSRAACRPRPAGH